MKICTRFIVSGRVQGVFFRQGTLEQAEKLNITGWVRNLNTGEVECLACGEEERIHELAKWLEHGPSAAHVTHLNVQALPWEEHPTFEITS